MRRLKQENYFPIIILVHFAFWAIDLAMYSGDYKFTSMHIVGEVFSSWVVTVLAANFLMATRARWVERLFGGLDKMYLIHRRSAMIACVLLLLHFVVVPRDPSFTIGKPLGFTAILLIFLGVVFAASPPLKRRIPYAKWLFSHKMMGFAFLLGIGHSLRVPTLTSELPIVRTYVYGMAALGVGSWIYKTFLYGFLNRNHKFKITGIERFPNDVVEVEMKPEGDAISFVAGQFAFFSFEGKGRSEPHPFTISSPPSADHLRISVKALGDHTSKMQTSLEVGAGVKVRGPYGRFDFRNARHKKQLWLAGGIGATPFLSFAGEVRSDDLVTLIWSVRTEAEANQADEFSAVAEKNDGFDFVLHSASERGRFAVGQRYASVDLTETSVFICGPEAMRESYITQLLEKGVSIDDIHYEEFSFR